MTQALIDDLRAAVGAYRRDGNDFHLLNWVREADALRHWRETGKGLCEPGIFIHIYPRKESND
jgi:hypothetical protein